MNSGTNDSYIASILDDQSLYVSLDVYNLKDRLSRLPDQCREAWSKTGLMPLDVGSHTINNVVIIGMGGSAIAGDLLADMA